MSKIFDLIKKLCPDGVEFREIEEIFIMKNGYTPSKANKDFWENGTIPWFRMEDIRENGRILSDSIRKITPQAVKCGKLIPKNSIIVATTATIGEHALAIADSFLMNQQFTSFTIRELLKDKLDVKFVFYYFFKICEWCKQNTNSSSFPSVDMPRLKKVKFPVPPLEVQREIVRILDCFTLLTAELTAELTARKKQYEFYRDRLLSFDELNKNGGGCELKMLGEVGEIRMCKRILKEQTSASGEIPFYKIGTFGKEPDAYIPKRLFDEYKARYSYPKIGEILISASGTIGRTVVFNGEDAYFQDSNIVWVENNESQVLNKYLFYFYQIADWNIAEGGTIKRLYNDNLKKLKIPVPSLSTQRKIVNILDKFDTLVNSISDGLPHEIELRRKQYEYYRELLLNFKEKSA